MSRREQVRQLIVRSREVVLLAAIAGVITGFGVLALERVVLTVLLERVIEWPTPVRAFLPLTGLTVAAIVLHLGGRFSPATTDEYIRNYHEYQDLDVRGLPQRMVAAVATLGSGCPGGLEGPSMYLGAGVGTVLQARFRRVFGSTGAKTLMVAGAAAGVAAIFKAPATGAVFALEVPFRDDVGRRRLMPALIGAASGYLAFASVDGTAPILPVIGEGSFSFRDLIGAGVVGVGAGLLIRQFAFAIRAAKRFQARRPVWISVLVGGGVLAVLDVVTVEIYDIDLALGLGEQAISYATNPTHALGLVAGLLLIRCIGVTASVAGGGVVGLFVPLVVAGALIGRLAGGLVGTDSLYLYVIIGVSAALGAGYRVPLAAVMFVAEASGRPGFVVPGLIAAVGADLMMGSIAVTTYQQSGGAVNEYH